jgi:hypothetical protein
LTQAKATVNALKAGLAVLKRKRVGRVWDRRALLDGGGMGDAWNAFSGNSTAVFQRTNE